MQLLFSIFFVHNLPLNSTVINYVKQYYKPYCVIIVYTLLNIKSVCNDICTYCEYLFFGNVYSIYLDYCYYIPIAYILFIINIHTLIYLSVFIYCILCALYHSYIFITLIRLISIYSCNMSMKEYCSESILLLHTQNRLPIYIGFFGFKPLTILKWYMEVICNDYRYILHSLKTIHNNIYLKLLFAGTAAIIIKLCYSYNCSFKMPLINLNCIIYFKVNCNVLGIAVLLNFTNQLILILQCFILNNNDC